MEITRALIVLFFSTLALGGVLPGVASAEIGVTATEVLVGESTALTGPTSARALADKQGSDLYFKTLNEAGGIHGRKLRLISYDDAYDPKLAYDNTVRLVEKDKVFLLFQFFGTAPTRAIIPVVEKARIPLIAPQTGAEFLRRPVLSQVFLTRPGYRTEASEMVHFLVRDRHLKKIAIFYQDDSFGEDGRAQTNAILAEAGLKRTSEASYKRNEFQVEKAVETIQQGNPEAVILWSVANAASKFILACARKGFHPVFTAVSSVHELGFIADVSAVSEEIYVGQTVPFITRTPSRLLTEYLSSARSAGQIPNATGFEGYFNAAFLAKGLKAAGRDLTRAGLRTAFETMQKQEIEEIPIHVSATEHQALSKGSLLKLSGGVLTPVHQ